MITASRTGAFLLALFSLLLTPALAAEPNPIPDPKLCAEYLRDLKAYGRMAELLGCPMPAKEGEAATSQPDGFPPVVTDQPTTDSPAFPPVVGGDATSEKSSGAEQGFPTVEQSSAPPSGDPPPVESDASRGFKSSSTSNSGSTSGSRKKRKGSPPVASSSEDSDFGERRHRGHNRLRHEAKRAIRRLLRENGGFISRFSRSRRD